MMTLVAGYAAHDEEELPLIGLVLTYEATVSFLQDGEQDSAEVFSFDEHESRA